MAIEFGKPLPDQVTTERLRESVQVVRDVVEVDPQEITDSLVLAERIRGVAAAISDIVLSKGAFETTNLTQAEAYNPNTMPASYVSNILRRYQNPDTREGRMFVAQPDRGVGATLGVHMIEGSSQRITHEIFVPSERNIYDLLGEEPALWSEMGPHSQDFRSGRPAPAYPFHNRFYDDGAPQRYFRLLQELSTDLLDASGD